jgi:hypothetical protein
MRYSLQQIVLADDVIASTVTHRIMCQVTMLNAPGAVRTLPAAINDLGESEPTVTAVDARCGNTGIVGQDVDPRPPWRRNLTRGQGNCA